MKIHTKAGDRGESVLAAGQRVAKGDLRFEALGQLDELNTLIGWCRSVAGTAESLSVGLLWVQDRLMAMSAQLAAMVADESTEPSVGLGPADVAHLEAAITTVHESMPMPTSFVIPGGCELACRLHLARTACRRAERCVIRCLEGLAMPQDILRAFINRLSDTLFAWALHANHMAKITNPPWHSHS